MIRFEDRKSENLNKKILEVEKIERDDTGEVTRLYVEELRNDEEGLIIEGTSLNTKSLIEVLKTMMEIAVMDPNERLEYDYEQLVIVEKAKEDFVLPTEGDRWSKISWQVLSDNGAINIVENDGITTAKVTRKGVDQTSILMATITNGKTEKEQSYIKNKYFEVVVESRAPLIMQLPFSETWTQKDGEYNSVTYTVNCKSGDSMYIVVKHDDNLVDEIIKNNSSTVEFTIRETKTLNSYRGTSPLKIKFELEIYSDSSCKFFYKSIEGTITYYPTSTLPKD